MKIEFFDKKTGEIVDGFSYLIDEDGFVYKIELGIKLALDVAKNIGWRITQESKE